MKNPDTKPLTFDPIVEPAQGALLKCALLERASHRFCCVPEVLAAVRYIRRRDRIEHPAGKTDNGGRWYPANSECLDTSFYRSPSRQWPWSYMLACRTAAHCAQMHGADVTSTRRIARLIDKCSKSEDRDGAIGQLLAGIEKIRTDQNSTAADPVQ